MTAITGTGTTDTTSSQAGTTSAGGMGQLANKDEFLRLLVAQLQYQDPLQPQDGAAFVAQLAQFSQLEQTTETNSQLTALTAAQSSSSSAQLATLVGRSATARATNVTLGQGAPPPLGIHLGGTVSGAELDIVDSTGKTVRKLTVGAQAAGDVSVPWDGTDDSGKALPPGTYGLQVKTTVAGGGSVDAFAAITGKIDSLEFNGGAPRFHIGAATVSPSDIVDVKN